MKALWMIPVILIATPATAEVKSVTPAGFEVAKTVTIAATPAQVWKALGDPDAWWNPAHTYSGDAANLTFETTINSCFCEIIPADQGDGGDVQHGRVIYAMPEKALRLSAALGPLQAEGVSGSLTWELKPVTGGTQLSQSYVVGGYLRMGADKIAPGVDQVMSEQLDRLKAYTEKTAK